MGRIFKALAFLILVGFFGLAGYAYIGDLGPEIREVSVPVTLNVD